MKTLLSVWFCFALTACCLADSFPLVRNGVLTATVELPPNPSPQLRKVQAVFLRELQKASVKTDIVKGKGKIRFEVVPAPYIDQFKYTVSFPQPDVMLIRGTEKSVKFAVNRILHQAGIRYVMPGPMGAHYPKVVNFSLPRKEVVHNTGFRLFRNLYAENNEWQTALNNWPQDSYSFINHGIARLFPVKEYGQDKWKDTVWGVVNGKRKKPLPATAGQWEPCYTSQVTVDEAVKTICAKLKRNPSLHTVSLMHNDGWGQFCKCSGCAGLDRRKNPEAERLKKYPYTFRPDNNSESYYTWTNRVAEKVLKQYPDVYFGVAAYSETLLPPTFKLNDHVVPCLCFESYSWTDPQVRGFWKDLIKVWKGKAKYLGWWEYGYGMSAFTLPRAYFRQVDEVVKYLAANGCESGFVEGFPHFGEGPRRYLYLRYFDDPNLDCQRELDDWYTACVGNQAAAWLKRYYEFWDRYWTERVPQTSWFQGSKFNTYLALIPDGNYLLMLQKDDMPKLRALMGKTVEYAKQSGNAAQYQRAVMLMKEFEFYEASACMNAAGIVPPSGNISKTAALEICRNLKEIVFYARRRPEIARDILASWPASFWGGCYPYMRKGFERKYGKIVFPDALSNLFPWMSDKEVKKAYAEQAATADFPPDWKKTMDTLIAISEGKKSNIMKNPSFEETQVSWTGKCRITDTVAASGKKSLQITIGSAKEYISAKVPMNSRKTYFFSAKLFIPGDYPPGLAKARCVIIGRNKLGHSTNYYIPAKVTLIPGAWNTVMSTANVGRCYNSGSVILTIEGMSKGHKIYMDDVCFVEL